MQDREGKGNDMARVRGKVPGKSSDHKGSRQKADLRDRRHTKQREIQKCTAPQFDLQTDRQTHAVTQEEEKQEHKPVALLHKY